MKRARRCVPASVASIAVDRRVHLLEVGVRPALGGERGRLALEDPPQLEEVVHPVASSSAKRSCSELLSGLRRVGDDEAPPFAAVDHALRLEHPQRLAHRRAARRRSSRSARARAAAGRRAAAAGCRSARAAARRPARRPSGARAAGSWLACPPLVMTSRRRACTVQRRRRPVKRLRDAFDSPTHASNRSCSIALSDKGGWRSMSNRTQGGSSRPGPSLVVAAALLRGRCAAARRRAARQARQGRSRSASRSRSPATSPTPGRPRSGATSSGRTPSTRTAASSAARSS